MMATAEVGRVINEGVGVAPEEYARADVYGLLAALFYRPPSGQLLQSIASADVIDGSVSGSKIASCWCSLQEAARTGDPAAIQQEYDDNFISTGRPPVFLFGSSYLAGHPRAVPLNELREELAGLGLARRQATSESEDHISALCDVMRFLIVGDASTPPAPLEAQREFYTRHIAPWYAALCDAVAGAPDTDFYKHVARFAKEFFDLEAESFEIA